MAGRALEAVEAFHTCVLAAQTLPASGLGCFVQLGQLVGLSIGLADLGVRATGATGIHALDQTRALPRVAVLADESVEVAIAEPLGVQAGDAGRL